MKSVPQETKDFSIKSLASTFSKLSNAFDTMTEKGANTTLVKKRKTAVKVGLDGLKWTWYGEDFPYDKEVIVSSRKVLQDLMPSIEKQVLKAKEGSPQKTLNERRFLAFQLAIETLESLE